MTVMITSRRATSQLFFPAFRLVCLSYVPRIVWLASPQNAPHGSFRRNMERYPTRRTKTTVRELFLVALVAAGWCRHVLFPPILYCFPPWSSCGTCDEFCSTNVPPVCNVPSFPTGLWLAFYRRFRLAFHGGVNDGTNVVMVVVVVG
jgi:hypothetical protein